MDETLVLLIVGIVVFVLFLLAFSLLFAKKPEAGWKMKVVAKLNELHKLSASNDPIILRSILIDADKLLDNTLKYKRVHGETMGERLKNAKRLFDKQSYNELWEAHKLRNRLVHDMEITTNTKQLKANYKKFIKAVRYLSS